MLNKDEYITKIANLFGASKDTIKIIIKNNINQFEEMYNTYVERKGKAYKFNGLVELENIKHIKANNWIETKNASFANSWIILPDLQSVLTKRILTDKYTSKQRFNCLCNHLVCPNISNSIGLDSARYYIAQEKNELYLLTPNFLNEGEQLKTGKEIKSNCFGLSKDVIKQDLQFLERYINLNGGNDFDNESARQNYIKQTIFWYLIKNQDQADRNWGLVQGDILKFSPNYDYDFCFDTDQNGPDTSRINDKNIEFIINKYKKEKWFIKWFEDSVLKMDIESNFKGVENKIPRKYSSMYEQYRKNASLTLKDRISRMRDMYMPNEPEIV